MKKFKKLITLLFCSFLVFGITGCKEKETPEPDSNPVDTTVLGEGNTSFNFEVIDQEGNQYKYEIFTDKTTVGDALQELNLIEGEESDYGLYVKKVNGILADYDTDGVYWAFYEEGQYASQGVDSCEITEGSTYSFKIEK